TISTTMACGLGISIYTLFSLALLAMNGRMSSYYICPFFYARRQSVFTGLYKWDQNQLVEVEEECNMLMEDWLDKRKEYEEKIIFISPHIDVFTERINDIMESQAILLDHVINRIKPSNMHTMLKWTNEAKVQHVAPKYLRKTEAETKLINKQKDEYRWLYFRL